MAADCPSNEAMMTPPGQSALRPRPLRPLHGWTLGRSRARWQPHRARSAWAIALGLALAAAAGYAAGGGNWRLAVLAIAAPCFLIAAAAAPERMALGLIVALPFLIYPASTGTLSVFLGIPLFGFTSLMLLSRLRDSLHGLRYVLPIVAFGLLVVIATFASVLSSDPTFALTRVAYLLLFGLFALALAATIRSGRLTTAAVARAIVYSGVIAAAAVIVQFVAQFGGGKQSVINWLDGVYPTFGGERAADARAGSNWVINDFDLLRGVFPFMSPGSAGQYLMLPLIAALWLRRERKASGGPANALELVSLVVIAAALLFTFSRQAWVGAAVGVIALGVSRRPLWMLAVILEIFLVASVVPVPGGHSSFGDYLLTARDTSTESSGTRIDLWSQAVDLIPGQAVSGVGPGLYATLNPGFGNQIYYAHNVFLDATVELGVAGGLALLTVFGLGLRSAIRRRATLAFALLSAYVVANLFDDVLYFPRNGLLLAVAFALIAGGEAASRKREPARQDREDALRPGRPAPRDTVAIRG